MVKNSVRLKVKEIKKPPSDGNMPVDKLSKVSSDNVINEVKEEVDSSSSKLTVPKIPLKRGLLNNSFERMTIGEMSNQSGFRKAYTLLETFYTSKNIVELENHLTSIVQVEINPELASCTNMLTLITEISQNKGSYNSTILALADRIKQQLSKYATDKDCLNEKNILSNEQELSDNQSVPTKRRNKPATSQGKRRLTGLYGENDNLPQSPIATKKSKKSDSGSMKVINNLLDQTVASSPSFGESLNQVKQKKSPIKRRGQQTIDSTPVATRDNTDTVDKDEIVVSKKPNKKGHNIKFVDEVYPNRSIVQIREFELIPNERTHFQPNKDSNSSGMEFSDMNEGMAMKRHLDDDENSIDDTKEIENNLPYEILKIDRKYVEIIPFSYEEVNKYIYDTFNDNFPIKLSRNELYEETPEYKEYLELLNTERSNGLRAFHDMNSTTNLLDETIQKLELEGRNTIEYDFIVPVQKKEESPQEKNKALTLVEKLKSIKGPVSGEINSIMAKLREQGVIKTAKDKTSECSTIGKSSERKTLITNDVERSMSSSELYGPSNYQRGSWELASVVSPPSIGGGWTSMNSGQINRESTFSESRARELNIVPCKFYEKGNCHFNLECTNLHGNEQTVGYKKACGIVVNNKKKSYDYDKERHPNLRRNYDNSLRRRVSPQPEHRSDYDDKDRNRKRRTDDDNRRNSSTKRQNYVSKHRDDEYDVVADRRYLTASHV
uniref:C3H1-type domain-containing protein n=1 Tax=Strongyloides venezuelensis TaxID=75913 RepID=A0A0K0FK52_STRVS